MALETIRHLPTRSEGLGSKKQKDQKQPPNVVAPIADAVPGPPQEPWYSRVLHALLNYRAKKNLNNSLSHSVSKVVTHRSSSSGSSEQLCGIRTVKGPLSPVLTIARENPGKHSFIHSTNHNECLM